MCLEFREGQLDGIEIGRIGRQEQQPGALACDGFTDVLAFVRGEIVEHDDVPFAEGRGELGFDVRFEDVRVHGAIDDPWRGQAIAAQSGDEGHGFPMPVGDAGDQPPTFGAAPSEAGHLGREPRFVNEHQVPDLLGMGAKPSLTPAPDRPRRLYVRAAPFVCVCRFF